LIQVVDEQFEMNFEFENRPFELIDLETNATIRLDPNTIRATYQKAMLAKRERFENYCLQHKIDLVTHTLKEPINKVLTEYLQKRSKMM
jgi:nickel-dependent lactate racemase